MHFHTSLTEDLAEAVHSAIYLVDEACKTSVILEYIIACQLEQ